MGSLQTLIQMPDTAPAGKWKIKPGCLVFYRRNQKKVKSDRKRFYLSGNRWHNPPRFTIVVPKDSVFAPAL